MPECVYKITVPSVTTILSSEIPDPDYDKWVLAMGKAKVDKIMSDAANRGSAMHVYLENFIENFSKTKNIAEALKYTQEKSIIQLREENIPEDKIKEGLELFYKFYYSDYVNLYDNVVAIELPIYSPSLFYRGKLDIFYKDKLFGFSITDFKSSNGKIKKDSIKEIKYFLQLGAYANCIDEMYKSKNLIIKRASILCIDKKSEKLQEIECSGNKLEDYKEQFKTLVKQYHIKYEQDYLIEK